MLAVLVGVVFIGIGIGLGVGYGFPLGAMDGLLIGIAAIFVGAIAIKDL